jgi:hypothetical protein
MLFWLKLKIINKKRIPSLLKRRNPYPEKPNFSKVWNFGKVD